MQWDDLKFVLAAARSQSFVGAAAMLKVAHTTIGRRIKALEDTLGEELFDRTRDGCAPTEFCRKLLPVAERMEAEARQALTLKSEAMDKPKGLVQLHTGAWMIEALLIPAFPKLQEQAPELRVFFIGDVVEDKSNLPEFSMSLRYDVMPHRSELEIALRRVSYAVYRHKDTSKPKWVSTSGGAVAMQTFRWAQEQGIAKEAPLLANDATLALAAIKAGVGQGLIPCILGEREPDLIRVSQGPPELVRTLRALIPRHVANTAQIKTVLAWVKDIVDDLPWTEPVEA